MVSVFVLPLLSILYYYLTLLWEQHMGSSSDGGAGSKAVSDEDRRARDIAEEQAIKNSAAAV
jgi:hypothetical protein